MNKPISKTILTNVLIYIGILGSIIFCWQLLELMIEGVIFLNRIDNFIAVFLSTSLYYNYQNYMRND
ncbi:uncharacterized protein CBO05P1_101 [Clostridium botulinum B str. Osaka05]|uniref:Uncharacterized protein n=1 Tax=Clostridium botulinum B str. Osaka05 TaxID=1407017 RepID=A0A060N5J2_CLOBO|nr:hypothetical protein [Clostridium botulinum]BAO04820.1 uncharacterized protein CBO05P1_101 [Clostridium botulinum B str. Osaka05]